MLLLVNLLIYPSLPVVLNPLKASWVDLYDAPKTLLLVYFAGHGRPGDAVGELAISGYQTSPSDVRRYLNTVVWNITENNLHEIQSDVLQVFDCCFAGFLGTRGGSQQSFEYLAATGADDTTASPGDTSFTSALIWALKELAKDRTCRFTTVHLLEMIQKAPNFPEDQKPVLSKRRETSANERIILHKVGSSVGSNLNGNGTVQRNTPHHDVVTLKFVFNTRPTEQDIRNLGMDLNHVVRQHQLHVNRIMWGGIVPKEDMVVRFVSNLKASLRWRLKRSHDGVDADSYPSKATAMAAQFVEDLQEEVKEHVHDQVQEEVPQRVHEELQREKEEMMSQRMLQKTPTISMLE